MTEIILLIVILFSPLMGGVLSLQFKSIYAPIASVGISLVVSLLWLLRISEPLTFEWSWIQEVSFSILMDKLALVLIVLVSLISLLVVIFSTKYMERDTGKYRYFAFLGFFVFSMIGLVFSFDFARIFSNFF